MRRPVLLLSAAALALGTATALAPAGATALTSGVTPAAAAAVTGKAVVTGTAAAAVAAGDRPSWSVRHGEHPSRAATARRATATPATQSARLDPSLTTERPASNGTVRAAVTGRPAAVAAAVRAAGGRVLVATALSSSAVLPASALTRVASAAGVSAVSRPERPYALDAPSSEAVHASGADTWQAATPPITGATVKLAIIDLGFGTTQSQYDAEVAAGHLGTSPVVVNEGCTNSSNASTAWNGEDHGLAVAEIAHQQAPATQLYLYCIGDEQGAAAAELAVEGAGIKLISSSVGWYNDSRGDGTGPAGSLAATAQRARRNGILWVNSAGNEVPQHWSGTLSDIDADHYLDIGNHSENTYPYESDYFTASGGSSVAPNIVGFDFSWDAWPTTANQVTLRADGVQCAADYGSGGLDDCSGAALPTIQESSTRSGQPTVSLDTSAHPNTSQYEQIWEVSVQFDGAFTSGLRYDLFGLGNFDGASDLACPTADSNGDCIFSAGAKTRSVIAPANSPYVLAAGAADVGADGTAPGTLEYFSSQGPTIDGRVKPDLTGWDGLSSYVYGNPSPSGDAGFYGTSAAAPSIAGAAALVMAANPQLDAAQVQDFLQRRAGSGAPQNPPNNATGHGLLTLGSPTGVAAPAGAQYQATTPVRILDTRTTTGGHHAVLGAGATVTVSLPSLPADATAVAVNLTGVGATAGTYLSAYPGGTAFPGTSNLNLSKVDPTAAVFAIVTVRNKSITIRNSAGTVNAVVDELGWFGTGAEPGRYTGVAPAHRVLDTRTTTGNHHAKLGPGGHVTVNPALPAGSAAAVVNMTSTGMAAGGYLSAAPTCTASTSTLNYGKTSRANLAIVALSSSGTFCVVDGGGPADVIVDVVGVIGSSGAGYVALPSAQRIVDTRTGNGGSAGQHPAKALAAATSTVFYGSNVGIVPASATGLLTGVVEAGATASGYLTLFAGATKPSAAASSLNFSAGRTVANAAIVGLVDDQFGIYNSAGSTSAAVDLFGYFVPPAG